MTVKPTVSVVTSRLDLRDAERENIVTTSKGLTIAPWLDSEQMAETRRRELDVQRDFAAALGRSAVEAANNGRYFNKAREKVDWKHLVDAACAAKRSIPPSAVLPTPERTVF